MKVPLGLNLAIFSSKNFLRPKLGPFELKINRPRSLRLWAKNQLSQAPQASEPQISILTQKISPLSIQLALSRLKSRELDIKSVIETALKEPLHYHMLKISFPGPHKLLQACHPRIQVIQGLHMVSGTQCTAWSDQLRKQSESRAATLKGQCLVGGHWGEFPYILRWDI